ncbi:MAG: branched-chain amino acid ABC transporter permease [Candidatus Bipolaricaulota bacterium]|nr:MAG: branched-chain amino acid ABC transporter permease [Candidatus Bipolaricaulota bacterium]
MLSRIPQLLFYGLVSGSILALGGIGVSLTYSILRFSNFAHGDMMALGAYLTLALIPVAGTLGIPSAAIGPLSFGPRFIVAAVVGMACTFVIVVALDRLIFRRLRKAGRITLMITTIGIALSMRNALQFFWGPQPQYYTARIQLAIQVPRLAIRVKPDQLFVISVAVLLVALLHLFLRYTKTGKAMRATSDNPSLAQVTGINTERIILWTWVIGASLAALAGVLAGVENKFITPELGWQMLLSIFAAVILGGIGNPYGAILGGVIVGVSEEVSTAFISTGYKPAVAFGILVLMLLIRPTGLLGRRS